MILDDLLVQDYSLVFKDSAVVLDDTPYYIHAFNGSRAECLNIGSQDHVFIDFSKVKSVKMPNTGLVNYRGVVINFTRIPCRRYKHGLTKENVHIVHQALHPEASPDVSERVREGIPIVKALSAKALYNTFMGIYPSLEDAIEMMQDGLYSVAFDRQFSVNTFNDILYKEKVVGSLKRGNKIMFRKEYEHLQICLPKVLQ